MTTAALDSPKTIDEQPTGLSRKSDLAKSALLVLLCVVTVLALIQVWIDIFSTAWRDDESSHILLVPFVFAWLIWNQCNRSDFNRQALSNRLDGRHVSRSVILANVCIIPFAMTIHEIGLRTHSGFLWHSSAIASLIGGLLILFPRSLSKKLLPAIGSLVFLIPIPGVVRESFSTPLQIASAELTEFLLSSVGLEVKRSGCMLTVSGTPVAISEACNGMRMLFAVVLVAYSLVFSYSMRPRTRIMILLCAPVFAVLMNIIRLIMTVALFGTASESTAVQFHDINGWLMPLLLMFAVVYWTSREDFTEQQTLQNPENAVSTATLINVHGPFFENRLFRASVMVNLVFLSSISLANCQRSPSVTTVSTHRSLVAEQIAQFPFVVDNWIGTNLQLHPEEIDLLQPQAAFRRVYRNLANNREFELLVVYSAHCRTLSGHEPGRCMTGQGWICCSDEMQSWNTGEATVCGRDFVFQNGSSREQVTSILVAPSFGASGRTEFIAMAAADFRLDPFGALAIRISTSEPLEIADWNAQILPFVTALQPMIRQVHFP